MVGNPAQRVDEADEAEETETVDGARDGAADERTPSTDGPLENGECAEEAVSEGHADGNGEGDAVDEADCGDDSEADADAAHSRQPC